MNPNWERGRLLYGQNRYEDARREFTKALATDPDDHISYAYLALIHGELKEFKLGREMAQKAISLSPEDDFGYYALAHVEFDWENLQRAETAIRQAIEINPYDGTYYALLAVILGRFDRWKAALEVAETGLQYDPENVNCQQVRAHALSFAGKAADAVTSAQKTVSNDPESPYAHATLGWVYLRKGDHKSAIEHFTQSLRLDPGQPHAQEGLLHALRARFPLYRWMLQFSAWHAQFSGAARFAIVIGIMVIPRAARGMAAANPQLKFILIPLAILVSSFIWFSWIAEPVTNITLLAHPLGQLALNPRDRREATVLGFFLIGTVLLLLGGIFMPSLLIAAGLLFLGFFLMGCSTRIQNTMWLRDMLFWGIGATSVVAGAFAAAFATL